LDKYQLFAVIAIFIVLLLIIVLSSRSRIIRTYNKYMRLDNFSNITGKELAFFAKQDLELKDMKFALTKHKLGDAYNYKHDVLILSEDVCNTASLASLTIVAHELGHAMQRKENNSLFMTSIFLNKITKFTNSLILPLLVIGLFFYIFQYPNFDTAYTLLIASGALFCLQILNKILNIPLEYNASNRALKYLKKNGFLSEQEVKKAHKLLNIAAQTYIAGLLDGIILIKRKRKK